MPGDRDKYIEAGMNGYVSKPMDQRDLAETIVRVLSGGPSDGTGFPKRKATDGS